MIISGFSGGLPKVYLQRFVNVLTYVFAVFFALPDALREQVFYLTVHGAEVVFSPGSDGII